ncbi:MAG: MBL fold metallo-hydrolase [Candidatus Marinimicrobia bacterium]|nr:MBL fold metallo-hydrolase [FCB group bacterium]MBL7028237.1 MBL fold metallo-hydrolase [Candidatus Neomarinimicrobiota bacterium]
MKIRHYLYNAFIIEENGQKLAIDAGRNLWWTKLNSLIPRKEWADITHIFSTHGDPDHFDYAVELAEKSQASVICHHELAHHFDKKNIYNLQTLKAGETIETGELTVQGLPTAHGPLPVKLGGGLLYMRNEVLERNHGGQAVFLGGVQVQNIDQPLDVFNHGTVKLLWGLVRLEKDNIEAFARGVLGYKINIGDKSIVNLGDTLYQEDWAGLEPDVLMVPIGGSIGNTMDVREALVAVKEMNPKHVIPCHYSGSFLWKRNINPTDDQLFKAEVEKLGIQCHIMRYGDEIGDLN